MPDQTYTYKPPLSYLTNSEVRALGFHNYQVFDVLRGSGNPASMPDFHLNISSSTGSGPLYNLNLSYNTASANGLNLIKIGDKLIVGDDVDNTIGGSKQWYRYDITAISSQSASSASITVKYITNSNSGSDISPDSLHYDYNSYAIEIIDVNLIIRETNQQFLLG